MNAHEAGVQVKSTPPEAFACMDRDPVDGLPSQAAAAHLFDLEPEALIDHLQLPEDAVLQLQVGAVHAWALDLVSTARFMFEELIRDKAEEAERIAQALVASGEFLPDSGSPPSQPGVTCTRVLTPAGPGYIRNDRYPDLAYLTDQVRRAPVELRNALVNGIRTRAPSH